MAEIPVGKMRGRISFSKCTSSPPIISGRIGIRHPLLCAEALMYVRATDRGQHSKSNNDTLTRGIIIVIRVIAE